MNLFIIVLLLTVSATLVTAGPVPGAAPDANPDSQLGRQVFSQLTA